jgi:4-hydroxythreonine-4-phosphate dehydrogenase
MNGRPQLALTIGDPCGIGPEIILKALADDRATSAARILVIGAESHFRFVARELRIRWPFAAVVRAVGPGQSFERPVLLDLSDGGASLVPGQVSAIAGRAAVEAIEEAVRLARAGVVDGIVTAPIHKEAIALAGCSDPGHTEMLQRLTGVSRVGMLFWTEDYSVALLSTHMSLIEAIKRVRTKRILDQLLFVEREWGRMLGRPPRVAVAGLNPHSGEGGRFGVEEARYIEPAIAQARAHGLSVTGPVPPDVVFAQAKERMHDLVFALYHDQATIPVKLCYGRRAVNVTLGLPFVRTSVDHGTAMDIAGKGLADEESLVQATCLAAKLSGGRL